mgnify:CR=1 FL=1
MAIASPTHTSQVGGAMEGRISQVGGAMEGRISQVGGAPQLLPIALVVSSIDCFAGSELHACYWP